MTRFVHPNGSVETTPPNRKDMIEIYYIVSHPDDNVSTGVNRLAYKSDSELDIYKYKYEEVQQESVEESNRRLG